VRPLKLHCARHTYASRALASGKSLRWVAEQLGHANPELTLRTYAHVMPDREEDLSFADFVSVSGAPKRPQTAPRSDTAPEDENASDLTDRRRSGNFLDGSAVDCERALSSARRPLPTPVQAPWRQEHGTPNGRGPGAAGRGIPSAGALAGSGRERTLRARVDVSLCHPTPTLGIPRTCSRGRARARVRVSRRRSG